MADSLHYVQMGDTSDHSHECPSSTPWIVTIIIVFLIAVGLAVWLIVLYASGSTGGCNNRLLTLPAGKITTTNTQISGSWGTLDNDNDKVTLYVSQKPFVYNTDGTVTCNNTDVLCDTEVGSKQTASVTVTSNTSYNAMLVVTSDETCHYRVFGPVKVFTQISSDIQNKTFNIRDLNSCNGSVSETATYTTKISDIGTFRLGSSETGSSTSSNSFLVKYDDVDDPGNETETDQILARVKGTSQVQLAIWTNKTTDPTTPIICPVGTVVDNTCTEAQKLSLEACQWSYNNTPALGENKWCLTASQPLKLGQSDQFVCLSRNGTSALAITSAGFSDTWFNSIV